MEGFSLDFFEDTETYLLNPTSIVEKEEEGVVGFDAFGFLMGDNKGLKVEDVEFSDEEWNDMLLGEI